MKTPARRQTDAKAAVSRRRFLGATAAAGSTALMLPRSSQAAGISLEGYTNWPSVVAGGTLDFFLRDPQLSGTATRSVQLTFSRTGVSSDQFLFNTTTTIGNPGVPADASTNGCGWPSSYRLAVPANWPSGLYYVYVGNDGNGCTVPFIVRPAAPTPGVKTLVCIPILTAHAYNPYGGKSIYDYNSSGGVRASQVSLDRPLSEQFNVYYDIWSLYLLRWLAKNNVAVDFCTDLDLETTPSILPYYQLYVQAGHDEYWTTQRRNLMEAYVASGGNAAYLGGNTAWFQARLAPGKGVANRTLVCYKDIATDPVTDPTLKTVPWVTLATPRPENQTTGLGFLTGCSWTSSLPRPNTPFVVQRADHWAFAGTGLGQGTGFGGAYVGYECDMAAFSLGADQRPYPTGADGTPTTLRILAQADGSNWNALSLAAGGPGEQSGYSAISVFSRGGSAGTVFSAGSTDWAYGLRPELDGQTPTPISRITLNVLNKLKVAYSESADVRQFHKVVSGAVWNTYYTTGTTAPTGSGQALDGSAFRAYVQPVSGSVPVYRYRSATTGSSGTRYRYSRVTSLDPTGLSWVLEATAYNAYAIAVTDSTPIYEHYIYNPATLEAFYLYSQLVTPPAGWNAGPVVFYVPLDGAPAPAVTPAFTLTGDNITAYSGQAVASNITVNPAAGFTGSVAFTVGALPTAVTAKFSVSSSTTGTQLKINTDSTTPPGTYAVTVTGTASGGLVSTVTLLLVVTPQPTFTLSPDTTDLRLAFGGLFGGSVALTVVPKNGFNANVSFSVSGLPSGLLASFQPATSATGTTLQLSKNLLGLLLPGTYKLTVTGTSASRTDSAIVNVTVALLL